MKLRQIMVGMAAICSIFGSGNSLAGKTIEVEVEFDESDPERHRAMGLMRSARYSSNPDMSIGCGGRAIVNPNQGGNSSASTVTHWGFCFASIGPE